MHTFTRLGIVLFAMILCSFPCGKNKNIVESSSNARVKTKKRKSEKDTKSTEDPQQLRLVVLLVVDQLPSWSFSSRKKLFKFGFKRLLEQGQYFPRSRYTYASTFTAVGHTALVTGAPPSVSGIIANEWYDREEGRYINCVEDSASPLHVVKKSQAFYSSSRGGSPKRLKVETVGDALRKEIGDQAKVISISYKDRAAILAGGKRPTLAVWYDPSQAAFTSSTYYGTRLPAWISQLSRTRPISSRLNYIWKPQDLQLLKAHAGRDDGPGEPADYPLGAIFPHNLYKSPEPKSGLRETPLADELILETALAAIDGESLGQDRAQDLLIISFSGTDYVGHRWGQESWEFLDMLMRLDIHIGMLLGYLDKKVGQQRYAVVLTSDHGATRMVERSQNQDKQAYRVDPKAVETTAEDAGEALLGNGDYIIAHRAPTLYLSDRALGVKPKMRDRLIDAMVQAIKKIPGVGYVERTDRISGKCRGYAPLQAMMCRSVFPGRSGEIFYGAAPNSIISDHDYKPTTHGSANPDDQIVPIILFAPMLKTKTITTQVSPMQIAPTIAKLLGIHPPAQAHASPLY